MEKSTTLERFLKLHAPSRGSAPWEQYTKKRFGDEAERIQRAMVIPEIDYAAGADAYVRRKPTLQLLKIHAQEEVVSEEYARRTRRLFYARDMVDKHVCDLVENRKEYQGRLRALLEEE